MVYGKELYYAVNNVSETWIYVGNKGTPCKQVGNITETAPFIRTASCCKTLANPTPCEEICNGNRECVAGYFDGNADECHLTSIRSRSLKDCPSGETCNAFVPDRSVCSTAAYVAIPQKGKWKSKTYIHSATVTVDLGAPYSINNIKLYWGKTNGFDRVPDSIRIYDIDAGVCLASPEGCAEHIQTIGQLPVFSDTTPTFNSVSKLGELTIFDDEDALFISDILNWNPPISRAFGSEGTVQNEIETCIDYGSNPCYQMRGPYPVPGNSQKKDADLVLHSLEEHTDVKITTRVWTNTPYDRNGTISLRVDNSVVKEVHRTVTASSCVQDGWLGYPVGGTQEKLCFTDIVVTTSHTAANLTVNLGIEFESQITGIQSYFGFSGIKVFILNTQKSQDISFRSEYQT